jgi:hypothetical protein
VELIDDLTADVTDSSTKHFFLPFVLALLLSGCATVKLPLCPRLAALSQEGKPVASTAVNEFVKHAAIQRDVSITVISPFIAEFTGSWTGVTWLESNYPTLLCSFNPTNVIDPTTVHTVCTKNSPAWMRVVKDGRVEDLFLEEYLFKASCYPRLDGT